MRPELARGDCNSPSIEASPPVRSGSRRWALAGVLTGMILPPTLFYLALFRTALDLPILDDYDAILGFVNQWIACKSTADKVLWFLTSQHVEVKLFFLHAIVLLQYTLLGHLNFRFLSLFSEGFILLMALVLWKMFIPKYSDTLLRLTLFLPVMFLLFQLQYSHDLSVVTPGTAHIASLYFSLSAIYMLHKDERWSFLAGLAFLVLAIASFGNGFMVIPIGMLILLRKRRYKDAAVLLMVAVVCVAIYAYRFDSHVPEGGVIPVPRFTWLLVPLDCLYVLYFLGSAGGFNTHFPPGAFILGCLLLTIFIWMTVTGQSKKNPLLFDSALFLLLSAATAASRRAAFGPEQSLASRYSLYSITWVILAWMLIVEKFLPRLRRPWDNGMFFGVLAFSVLFSLCWDLIGLRSIQDRNEGVTTAIVTFDHPTLQAPDPFPVPPYRYPGPNGEAEGLKLRERMRTTLNRSIELGVYRPHF